MSIDIDTLLAAPGATLRECMATIDRGGKRICLVVDAERRLLDTVTDGDIRRAVLAGVALEAPISALAGRRASTPTPVPVTAPVGTDRGHLLATMQRSSIQQLPLVDEEGRVRELVTLDELMPAAVVPLQAMVMAGGFGKRLHPLTHDTPKPMLPVGDRPLLEHIINRLRDTGIHNVHVTTHFQPEKIRDHFGDGAAFGVDLRYVNEDQPLGTAGALGLMARPQERLLIMNGDILTDVDFRAMARFHEECGADLTVGVRQFDVEVPYGVAECEGPYVRAVREKPVYSFLVNAGIYLMEPLVHDHVRPGERLDMPDLIRELIEAGRTVVSFPIVEYWLDIGQHMDYSRAQEYARNGQGSE